VQHLLSRALARAEPFGSRIVVNSDCGPDQRCTRLVVGNNGSAGDPLDDLVIGFSESMHGVSNAFKAVHADRSVVYQKQ